MRLSPLCVFHHVTDIPLAREPLGAMHSESTEIDIDLTARKPPNHVRFLGVKRTWRGSDVMSANDPKPTFAGGVRRHRGRFMSQSVIPRMCFVGRKSLM